MKVIEKNVTKLLYLKELEPGDTYRYSRSNNIALPSSVFMLVKDVCGNLYDCYLPTGLINRVSNEMFDLYVTKVDGAFVEEG
jgi:hypothetical protein